MNKLAELQKKVNTANSLIKEINNLRALLRAINNTYLSDASEENLNAQLRYKANITKTIDRLSEKLEAMFVE